MSQKHIYLYSSPPQKCFQKHQTLTSHYLKSQNPGFVVLGLIGFSCFVHCLELLDETNHGPHFPPSRLPLVGTTFGINVSDHWLIEGHAC